MALSGEHTIIDVLMGHSGQISSVRLYYTQTAGTPPTQAQLDTAANTVFTTLGLSFIAAIQQDCFLEQIRMKIEGSVAELESFSSVAHEVGTFSGDLLPEECAVVIQRRTGKPGRSKRGRIFMPFVSEAAADDSALSFIGIPIYKALANAMETPLVLAYGTLSPRTPSFKTSTLEPVTQCRVVSEICSRRQRRNPKRPQYLT